MRQWIWSLLLGVIVLSSLVPSNCLNHCLLIINLVVKSKFRWNFDKQFYREMLLKMSSTKWRQFCSAFNVFILYFQVKSNLSPQLSNQRRRNTPPARKHQRTRKAQRNPKPESIPKMMHQVGWRRTHMMPTSTEKHRGVWFETLPVLAPAKTPPPKMSQENLGMVEGHSLLEMLDQSSRIIPSLLASISEKTSIWPVPPMAFRSLDTTSTHQTLPSRVHHQWIPHSRRHRVKKIRVTSQASHKVFSTWKGRRSSSDLLMVALSTFQTIVMLSSASSEIPKWRCADTKYHLIVKHQSSLVRKMRTRILRAQWP